ncbi:DUF6497 family protein [Thalassobius sp. Cn5-15]|jgi:hypothetical protein|uniref:DUF6497 family protein n=1 Tax=Thalassobius sp. Cn5-15 TaxID=2917763 RepID=UPI001EF24FD2|nr:DUF6497 family protein [Thalassobius sp. Cn5-15]MCG7493115.1 DUF6497 family protein [Thalassobius sp. Cn5-15]
MFDLLLTSVAAGALATSGLVMESVAPSGLTLKLLDQRIEALYDGGALARYRFVAPALAEKELQYDSVADDFAYLCESFALPDLAAKQADVAQIIISFSSAELEFGDTAPDIVQFFEAFRVENDRCIWEAY